MPPMDEATAEKNSKYYYSRFATWDRRARRTNAVTEVATIAVLASTAVSIIGAFALRRSAANIDGRGFLMDIVTGYGGIVTGGALCFATDAYVMKKRAHYWDGQSEWLKAGAKFNYKDVASDKERYFWQVSERYPVPIHLYNAKLSDCMLCGRPHSRFTHHS